MITFHYIAVAGLALTILAWTLQYQRMREGKMRINRQFTGLVAMGLVMLVIDNIQNGVYDTGLTYALLFAVTMMTFFLTKE
ncbi:Uncharacterised protein [uncultured archaeon]|nr:Uncharacterised protein [uncultured archaeon]